MQAAALKESGGPAAQRAQTDPLSSELSFRQQCADERSTASQTARSEKARRQMAARLAFVLECDRLAAIDAELDERHRVTEGGGFAERETAREGARRRRNQRIDASPFGLDGLRLVRAQRFVATGRHKPLRDGIDLLVRCPWVSQVHPADLARLAWMRFAATPEAGLNSIENRRAGLFAARVSRRGTGQRDWLEQVEAQKALAAAAHTPGIPVITELWQQRLQVAVEQIDRYAASGHGCPGTGHAMVFDLCAGAWRGWTTAPPYSLGGIAVCARRTAHKWRRANRPARRRRNRATNAARQAVSV